MQHPVVSGWTQPEILEILDVSGTLGQMGPNGWHEHAMKHVPSLRLDPLPDEPRRLDRGKTFENSPIQARLVYDLTQCFRMIKVDGKWCYRYGDSIHEDSVVVCSDSFVWRDWKKMPNPRTIRKSLRALVERGYLIEVERITRKAAYQQGHLIPNMHAGFIKKAEKAAEEGHDPHHGGFVRRYRLNWRKIRDELLYVGPRARFTPPTRISQTLAGQSDEANQVDRLVIIQRTDLPESVNWVSALEHTRSATDYHTQLLNQATRNNASLSVCEINFYDQKDLDQFRAKGFIGATATAFFDRLKHLRGLKAKECFIAREEGATGVWGSLSNPERFFFPKWTRRWLLRDLSLLRKDLFPSKKSSLISFDPGKRDFIEVDFLKDEFAALRAVYPLSNGNCGTHFVLLPYELSFFLGHNPTEYSRTTPGESVYWELKEEISDKREQQDVLFRFFSSIKARGAIHQSTGREARKAKGLSYNEDQAPGILQQHFDRYTMEELYGPVPERERDPAIVECLEVHIRRYYEMGRYGYDPVPETPDMVVDQDWIRSGLHQCGHAMGDATTLLLNLRIGKEAPKLDRKAFLKAFDGVFQEVTMTEFTHPLTGEEMFPQADRGMLNPVTMSALATAVKDGLRKEHLVLFRTFVKGHTGAYRSLFDRLNAGYMGVPWPPPWLPSTDSGQAAYQSCTLGEFLDGWKQLVPALIREFHLFVAELTYRQLVLVRKYLLPYHADLDPDLLRQYQAAKTYFVSSFAPQTVGTEALGRSSQKVIPDIYCPYIGGGKHYTHMRPMYHRTQLWVLPEAFSIEDSV